MIDFSNGVFLKLSKNGKIENEKLLGPLLTEDEYIISEYATFRDFVAFTNKRIFAVNVQGLTGKKKDITSLPYSKIQAFSIETAGVLDWDSELEIWFSGLGKVKFEFHGECDIAEIGNLISEYVLL